MRGGTENNIIANNYITVIYVHVRYVMRETWGVQNYPYVAICPRLSFQCHWRRRGIVFGLQMDRVNSLQIAFINLINYQSTGWNLSYSGEQNIFRG